MRLVVALSFLLTACGASSATPRAPASPPALDPAAWDRLTHALVGTWTMVSSGTPFVVSYKLISNGTALVEDWGVGSAHETESVFHPDHADIVLTHYCAQGNQPRLRASRASDWTFVFRFDDVTNRTPDQAVLVERTLRFSGGTFEDTEVYQQPDGTDDVTTYRFVR
jgi:hypothetical protein